MTLRANSETFGLIAWLKKTRVRLPLRALDIRFNVTDTVAEVNLDHVFTNDRDESLDVTYTFPLPAAAAVYRCEMIVDGRVTAAVVEEEVEARRQFVEAKAAGLSAALVEQHRDNVFSLQLGNVPARAVVVLRISYLQELERLVDSVSLRIPTCPGVRYIPGAPLLRSNQGRGVVDDTDQVPDASQISPPRIDALHPDAAQISVRGQLLARDVAASSILSPSHPLIARVKDETIAVSLALDAALADQDVLIRWSPQVLAHDSIVTTTAVYQDFQAALTRLKGPDAVVARRGPREVWFLVDRSGSMAGRNWEQSCAALHQALASLHPEDRVGISFFESSVKHFSDQLETVAQLRRDPNLASILSLGTDGGTEMLPALEEISALWNKFKSDVNDRHLVLITDGQVGNEDAILELVRKFPAGLRVHPLGIDSAVNDAVLLKLANATGGRCVFIHPNDSIVEAVLAVVNAIEAPTVINLAVNSPWFVVGTAPRNLSRQGETSILLGAPNAATEVQWTGTLATDGAWQPRAYHYQTRSPAVVLLRARRQIALLQSSGDRPGAIALAKRFNLLCQGACFIAIDRTTKTEVAHHHVYQPARDEVAGAGATAPSAGKFSSTFTALRSIAAPSPKTKKAFPQTPILPQLDRSRRMVGGDQPGLGFANYVSTSEPMRDWLYRLLLAAKRSETKELLHALLALPAMATLETGAGAGLRLSAAVLALTDDIEQRGNASTLALAEFATALNLLPLPREDEATHARVLRAAGIGLSPLAVTPMKSP